MSRLQTLLALSLVLGTGTLASAQSCADGVCSLSNRTHNSSAHYVAPDYGYSRYQPSIGYTGGTCGFGQACRECGYLNHDARSRGYQSNYMTRDRYEPVYRSPRYDLTRNDYYAPIDPRFQNRYDNGFRGFRRDDRYYNPRPSDGLRYPGVPRYDYGFTRTQPTRRPALNWHTDLRQAAQTVRTNPRPMLVTVTADWCSHCKRMKNETFTDARLIQNLNSAGYLPVRLDADANRELVQRIGVTSLPTTLIVSPDLQIQERLSGFRSAEQLAQSLRRFEWNAELQSDVKVAAK